MQESMHRADPRLRRLAFLWLLLAVGGGALALWFLDLWLQQALRESALDALLLAFLGLSIALAGGIGALAVAFFGQADQVRLQDRYPPEAMKTLRDVAIQRGQPAQRIARWMRMTGWLLVGLAVTTAGYALWLVWQLGRG